MWPPPLPPGDVDTAPLLIKNCRNDRLEPPFFFMSRGASRTPGSPPSPMCPFSCPLALPRLTADKSYGSFQLFPRRGAWRS